MLTQELRKTKVVENQTGADVLKGTGVAVLAAYVPLVGAFAVSQALGFTALEYPELSQGAAWLGVAVVSLSLPVAYRLRRDSVLHIVAASVIMFSVLGVLASFTM